MYVIIDPGHGGKDGGAVGLGLSEKNVVLDLALRMNQKFGEYENVTVSLTRWGDRYLSLSERATFANQRNADLFLSMHNNAASPSAHGFESFIYEKAGSVTARYQREIHQRVMAYLSRYQIRDRGQKRANFAVLRETRMPAILLENLFISNEKENQLLRDKTFLDGLAEAIVEGVANLFGLKKKKEKPMYRITVDGQVKMDTTYESKILNLIQEAIQDEAREIWIKQRD